MKRSKSYIKILIIPGNIQTPKAYPFWDRLLEMLKEHEVRKLEGMLKEQEIMDLINATDLWISIDSFVPHLVAYHKLKPGIVLWAKSDPLIFGYPTNTNLLKDRKYLKAEQFRWWKDEPMDIDAHVDPEVILREINKWTPTIS